MPCAPDQRQGGQEGPSGLTATSPENRGLRWSVVVVCALGEGRLHSCDAALMQKSKSRCRLTFPGQVLDRPAR